MNRRLICPTCAFRFFRVRLWAIGPSGRSKLGYESLMLTASMVGGLGSFGFDEAVGYAGEEEQGGRAGFRSRKVHDKVNMRLAKVPQQ